MIIAEKEILFGNESFTLTNQRAIFWKKEQSLILSDLHVGKSATFRKSGIPISKGVLAQDLSRLESLISHYNVDNLIIVGDLFHAEYNQDIQLFLLWFSKKENLKIELILGNHDCLSPEYYRDLKITTFTNETLKNNILFVHDITTLNQKKVTISGHTHPGVLIKGKAKQRIKLPCYQITERQLILPAFSNFTGLNTKPISVKCTNYAFTNEAIFELN